MGASCLRMVETMAMLKMLAEENIALLKKSNWKDEEDTLQMNARINKINELMKTMNFDWERIPREWDTEKNLWHNQKPKG